MMTSKSGLTRFIADHRSLVLAVCMGSALAHIGTSTMPLQIGALIDGTGLTPAEAGLFGFFQVGALAAGMLVIASWIDRFHPALIAVASAILAGLAYIGLFTVRSYVAELFCGTFAGLGLGFVFAATITGAAASEESDRLYAIGNGGGLLLIMGVMSSLPAISGRFGALGVFIGIAGLAFGCSLCFLGFKRAHLPQVVRVAPWRIPGAMGLLFSWTAFSLGTGALYAFSERIGKSIHIAAEAIGVILSAGVFVGVAGTGAAAYFGGRINRRRALVGGMLGSGMSCLILGYSSSFTIFAAAVFTYWASTMFLYSYLLGSAAQLDQTGRLGTLGGGMERLGYGAGAWIGGLLAGQMGYSATGALGCAGCLLGLLVGFPSLFRALDSHSSTARTSQPQGVAVKSS